MTTKQSTLNDKGLDCEECGTKLVEGRRRGRKKYDFLNYWYCRNCDEYFVEHKDGWHNRDSDEERVDNTKPISWDEYYNKKEKKKIARVEKKRKKRKNRNKKDKIGKNKNYKRKNVRGEG